MKKILSVLVLFIWLANVNRTAACNVVLNWNSTASPAVVGYNVYFGTSSGHYLYKFNAGNQTTATISNLIAGVTYFFAATTVDTNGGESGYSSEVSFIIPGMLTMTQGASSGSPASPAVIQFPVAPGHWYEVQATTDFQNWSSIWQTSIAVSNVWMQFTNQEPAIYPSRYYRLAIH